MNPQRITLAALTYHRPDGLRALLTGIAHLSVPVGIVLKVVIVDNSADATASGIVRAFQPGFPVELIYLHQPVRGLSAARNSALDWAFADGSEVLGFIDDDEAPDPDWLRAHLVTLAQTSADVSLGAVHARFEHAPARWISRGGFFDFDGYDRHQPMGFGHTSNVMFRLRPVKRANVRFAQAFTLTGGEDTAFFDQLLRSGAVIVFAPDAVVTETIVTARGRLRWLLRRWRRTGITSGMIRLIHRDGLFARQICFAAGLLRLSIGAALVLLTLPLALIGRFDICAHALRITARGLGFLDSVFDRRIEEYREMTR